MGKAKKSSRPRRLRREAERRLAKAQAELRKLDALQPGGSPSRAIELVSASQVEPDAARTRCAFCGGEARLVSHDVEEHEGRRLRVATLACQACRAEWRRYYRLGADFH